jgi:hypothetical protein
MTQHIQIPRTTLAAASRRRASARYVAEHVAPLTSAALLANDDADELLARAYRLRKKRLAAQVSAGRRAALLR